MKEQIYTIPVNEIYDKKCACPLCELEERIERESVEYALGAAMMEPDFRVESNELGYCNRHYAKMFEKPNKLSLALVLDTHLIEVRKKLDKYKKSVNSLKSQKPGLFKKSSAYDISNSIYDFTDKLSHDCMICKKVNFTMERYIDVIMYMYFTKPEFKKKFDNSDGFCMEHFKAVCKMIPKCLSDKQAQEFIPVLFDRQVKKLDILQGDIHKFTLKFDYRNKDMPWGNAQDAPIRTIETLAGKIHKPEEK